MPQSDLVERLRAPSYWKSSDGYSEVFDDAPSKAADEIERLRSALDQCAECDPESAMIAAYARISAGDKDGENPVERPGKGDGEREAIARQLNEWMPCVLEASIGVDGPGSATMATWDQLGRQVRDDLLAKADAILALTSKQTVSQQALDAAKDWHDNGGSEKMRADVKRRPYAEFREEVMAKMRDAPANHISDVPKMVGDGFVVVPREPTEAMLDVMHDRVRILVDPERRTCSIRNDREVWSAMIAAAPPAKGSGE